MPANTSPIYSLTPHIESAAANNAGTVVGPSANTAQDGTGANTWVVFAAGANGSYVQKVVFRSIGSPAATVARLYVCTATGAYTAGTTNTATNTMLVGEISLPAVTLSQTVQSPTLELALNYALAPSTKLIVSFGTTTGAAGTGYSVVAIGGDY